MKKSAVLTLVVIALLAGGTWWILRSDRTSIAVDADGRPLLPLVVEQADDASVPPAVADFYRSPAATTLWTSGDSDYRDQMAEALDQAALEGVSADDLHPDSVRRMLQLAEEGSDTDRAKAEVRLSTALLELTAVYARGSDLRRETEVEWRMDRDPEPTAATLELAAREGPLAALDSVRPTLEVYHRTVEALERYRQRRDTGSEWPTIEADDDTVVEQGESGAVVAAVRERLRAGFVGRERAEAPTDQPDRLDPELAAAIALFQARHGLAVDSVVGPETIAAMNVPLSDRIDQLVLNLDRIRRLPRDFGERAILVNVAGFELRVLEENRPVMQMAVVVGQPEWRTNVFSDSIEYLVVNPYWHVPESIEAAETLPSVKADPGYLAAHRISVVPADDNFGEPVDPGTIDWSSMSAGEMPWDFRQEPGPENSLGQIKFMFPNEHNIYLHDTPADALFQEDFRAFSHGCIRVEHPWELARYLVESSSETTADQLMAIRDSRERTQVELSESVPVFLAYLTSWVDDEGVVSFHQDFYDLDDGEVAALGREL